MNNRIYDEYPPAYSNPVDSQPYSRPIDVDDVYASTTNSGSIFAEGFSDKNIRHAFIRKVYFILMLQLSFTVGFICLFLFCIPVKEWVQSNPIAYWVSYIVFIVIYIALICSGKLRRQIPINYIALAVFTMALTYMTATISSFYNTTIVLVAMGMTAVICLSISLFAIQTKIDFTMKHGLIFGLVSATMWFGLAVLFTYLITQDSFSTYIMATVYGGLVALCLSLFLIVDTQMIVGGKYNRVELSAEEYVTGAMQLYLDIVYIFLIIISCSGR